MKRLHDVDLSGNAEVLPAASDMALRLLGNEVGFTKFSLTKARFVNSLNREARI